MPNSLRPHGLQHARLPCPSLSPRVCSNSCPLSQWCHPTISSSVTLFSSCPQSFPALGSFPTSQLRIGWPKYWSFSNSPSNEYSGLISFRIDWFDLLAVQRTLKTLFQHQLILIVSKAMLSESGQQKGKSKCPWPSPRWDQRWPNKMAVSWLILPNPLFSFFQFANIEFWASANVLYLREP